MPKLSQVDCVIHGLYHKMEVQPVTNAYVGPFITNTEPLKPHHSYVMTLMEASTDV